jgi:voltage-gated potassium channel
MPKQIRAESVRALMPVSVDDQDEELDKVPLTARLLLRESITARRAAGIIAGFTVLITIVGGILARLVDHQEFPTIGRGLWFALQTVTTVGYGDVTPAQTGGRVIAAVVMLSGIGFLAVITASVTASLIEGSRRRYASESEDVTRQLGELGERLLRIEAAWLDRLRAVVSLLLGVGLWLMTWVFPVTFIVMMACGCETHSRQLGRRALVFYEGEVESLDAAIAAGNTGRDRGHDKRTIVRVIVLFLSVAIPIGFVAYADHIRNTTGINWIGALGALVALSLVICTAVLASRR